MEQEFVPYTVALKLKELGFDEPCFAWYVSENYGLVIGRVIKSNLIMDAVLAPTFSQAFRWFRERYRMFHEVFIDTEPTVDEPDKLEFTYIVLHMVGMEEMHTSKNKRFNTYEEAELACLSKLIEIVESRLD